MKVILKADIKGVGKKDEVINASDGYARNFLFPKKLAVEANAENMLQIKRGFVRLHKTITITRIISYLYAIVLLILSSASIVSNSHNPFIYFRF